jgi:hypothetical protein
MLRDYNNVRDTEARAGSHLDARTAVVLAMALGLAACAAPIARMATPVPQPACSYAACGTDAQSLAKVTAASLQTTPETIVIGMVQPQFNGAVLVWRARVKDRSYLCREGRDPGEAGAVHYVDCRRQSGGPQPASLKAFP